MSTYGEKPTNDPTDDGIIWLAVMVVLNLTVVMWLFL